jgi:citronellol/citronellal dehydrogenase
MSTPAKTLSGKTVFITGASRGIGRAIALRCAVDGANVAIAAKTLDPHPKLPGTILSVAREIQDAGGRALPLQTDIRDEGAIRDAVAATVAEFGGIDVLVNNASAISPTGLLETPMKRYDLMMDVNVRGTYAVSQACVPYLEKAPNPHVLTISPPISTRPYWYGRYPAHAISKVGMTMVTLGISEEFKDFGIAANALWPRTLIATDAVRVFFSDLLDRARKPEIVADAAHAILTKDSRRVTGNCFYDEDVLRAEGVTDFDAYAILPGGPLATDIYVD